VLIAGTLIGVAANVLALVAPSVGVFSAVFALSGIQMAAVSVSGLNVMLEFAPGAEERPTYIGLGTTLMAPVFFAAPLVAGVMADGLGFPWVFVAATAGGLLSLGLLVARVHDPRQRRV
jgi:MFS family permease